MIRDYRSSVAATTDYYRPWPYCGYRMKSDYQASTPRNGIRVARRLAPLSLQTLPQQDACIQNFEQKVTAASAIDNLCWERHRDTSKVHDQKRRMLDIFNLKKGRCFP